MLGASKFRIVNQTSHRCHCWTKLERNSSKNREIGNGDARCRLWSDLWPWKRQVDPPRILFETPFKPDYRNGNDNTEKIVTSIIHSELAWLLNESRVSTFAVRQNVDLRQLLFWYANRPGIMCFCEPVFNLRMLSADCYGWRGKRPLKRMESCYLTHCNLCSSALPVSTAAKSDETWTQVGASRKNKNETDAEVEVLVSADQ